MALAASLIGPLVSSAEAGDPWLALRHAVRTSIWGPSGPPTRSIPDGITLTNVSGMTRLEWNISSPFLPMTATVFYKQRQPGQRTSSVVLQHHSHDWVPLLPHHHL